MMPGQRILQNIMRRRGKGRQSITVIYKGDGNKLETRYFSMDYLIKKVSFGKYKDKYTLIDIFTHDNSYALWLLNNFEFAPGLKGVLRDSLHIKDNTKREKFLLEIWENYNSNKMNKPHKKRENKVKISEKNRHLDKPLLEKILHETQTGKAKWIIDFKNQEKTRYKTSIAGYDIELTKTWIMEKETCKKKEKYHLTCVHNDICYETGHNESLEIAYLVERNAKPSITWFEKEEDTLIQQYSNVVHIGCADFIVRTNMFKCFKHHNVEDIAAEITIVDRKGNIIHPKVHATYCKTCNKYFIQQSTYEDLKHRGIILHRIITNEEFQSGSYLNISYDDGLAEESILHQMGYNVGKTDNLSDSQRWIILECMVDNNIASKSKIVAYLNSFIRRNGNKSNMEDSVDKWICDRTHIQNYKIDSDRWVKVGNLSISKYKKHFF